MNYEAATDAMSKVFADAWGATYPVKWPDLPMDPVDGSTPWAKFNIQHTSGNLSALAGANLLRKFRRDGVIVVQILAPGGQGKTTALQLAQTVVQAYEDADVGIHFKYVQALEYGQDGAYYRVDVYANFDYDHVR